MKINVKSFFEKLNPGKSVIVSICVMLASAVLFSFLSLPIGLIMTAIALIYSATVCIITYRKNKKYEDFGGSLVASLTREYLVKCDYGIILIDEHNHVAWCNPACSYICKTEGAVRGKHVTDVIPDPFNSETVKQLREGKSVIMKLGSSSYELRCTDDRKHDKSSCFITMQNVDVIEEIRHEMLMKRTAVAVIHIDNYSEATRSIGDTQKREAQNAIGGALDAWSKELGGILKEYERNHFLLILEENQLQTVIDTKFAILDTIKQIEIEGVTIPFTASIGVSRIDGPLSEKMAVAKSAIELALSRGGDQAVVKTESNTEFFGAKLLGSHKHSRVRTRNFAVQLVEKIKSCGNVIIMGHRFADHDSIGSCFGVARLCTYLGKETHVIINIHDVNLKPIFAMMRGIDTYSSLLTDAVSAQDCIRSDTLVIVCDVNNIRQFEAPDVFKAASDYVIIDHHRRTETMPGDSDNTYIEPSSSSASEIVAEILEFTLDSGNLPSFESNLMYAGIMLDTKQFTKNTGATTFAAAQYLRSEGCNPTEAQNMFRTDLVDFVKEASFESDVVIENDIAFSKNLSKDTNNADRIAMAKAADRLLGVSRIRAAFTMCVIDGAVCISGRSDGTFNVQIILEKLGGGGHYDAAAAQVRDGSTLDEVMERLKSLCREAVRDA